MPPRIRMLRAILTKLEPPVLRPQPYPAPDRAQLCFEKAARPALALERCVEWGGSSMSSGKMIIGSFVLVVATAAAASAQTTGAPIVSRPSNAAVSPNLSDLPAAHWSHGESPKVVPPPKRLP